MRRGCLCLIVTTTTLCLSACQGKAPASGTVASSAAKPVPIAPPPVKPPDALASQNTNWGSVIADVIQFRRKGNTLTALVRLRNPGTNIEVVQMRFDDARVLDQANAKTYAVLKDENDGYIASYRSGFTEGVASGGTLTFWMKFPAPPADVRTAT